MFVQILINFKYFRFILIAVRFIPNLKIHGYRGEVMIRVLIFGRVIKLEPNLPYDGIAAALLVVSP